MPSLVAPNAKPQPAHRLGQPPVAAAHPQTNFLHPSSFRLHPFIDHLTELVLILAIGVTPLLFSPAFSELFEFPKMVFVYVLSAVSILLIAAQLLHRHHLSLPRSPLDTALGLYLLVFLVATAFSLDIYTSIVGYYTRFTGGLTSLLAYIILFYLALIYLAKSSVPPSSDAAAPAKSEESNEVRPSSRILSLIRILNSGFRISAESGADKVQPLLTAWIFTATLVSIYAILEHFGHDPSCLILRGTFTADCWVQDVTARAFATFGQPNWLACYLITALPIALIQLIPAHSRWSRGLWGGSIILMYAAWWFTYSRAGWLGLAAALVILAFCLPYRLILNTKWWLAGILACCAIITATSFNLAASRVGTSLESGADDSSTGQIRLLVWQGTANLIAHHPLLGTGPETFAYSFLPHRPRAMNDTTEWNFLYNKAHNEVLQIAATTGLLGLITWLGLFVVTGFYLWRQGIFINLRRLKNQNSKTEAPANSGAPSQKLFSLRISNLFRISNFEFRASNNPLPPTTYNLISAALFAGLIGVFVAQLLGFAVVVTSLYFWLALALIFAPAVRFDTIHFPRSRIAFPSSVGLLATGLFLLAGYALVRYTKAEMLASAAQGQNAATAIIDDQQAVNQNPLEPTYHKDLALAYASFADIEQNTGSYYAIAADQQAQITYRLNPHDQIIIKQLGFMYQQLALTAPSYQKMALKIDQAAWDLAPTDASAAETLADLQLQYGQKDASLKTYNQLIKLRPAPESYLHRAQWYKTYGTPAQYRAQIEQVLKLDPHNKDAQSALDLLETKSLPGDE